MELTITKETVGTEANPSTLHTVFADGVKIGQRKSKKASYNFAIVVRESKEARIKWLKSGIKIEGQPKWTAKYEQELDAINAGEFDERFTTPGILSFSTNYPKSTEVQSHLVFIGVATIES